jgi:large conductance mechanosensitive channel
MLTSQIDECLKGCRVQWRKRAARSGLWLEVAADAEAVTLNYGVFINTVLDFLIVAFAIFMVIKLMNSAKKKEEEAPAAPPAPSVEEILLTEIRDALRSR